VRPNATFFLKCDPKYSNTGKSMRFYAFLLISCALLLTSGCQTVSVSENNVSKTINKKVEKQWKSMIFSSAKTGYVDFTVDIKDLSINISEKSKFHDVNISIKGNLIIKDPSYSVNTPIIIELGAHSELEASSNKLFLKNILTRSVTLPTLYNSYSVDLIPPISEALNSLANKEIGEIALLDLKDYQNRFFELKKSSELKKTSGNRKIYLSNK
jgi:hypothetical protein